MRPAAVAATAALALTAAAMPAGPVTAADDTPGYSVEELSVEVHVGPDRDQPCTVVADLYRPDAATADAPAPAILTTHGFGGSKDDGSTSAIARGFVGEGYVVLAYSGLGFGGSGCKIHLDDPDWDGAAGTQLVDLLADRPFVAADAPGDPRVGMIGGSYGGQVQFAVAMQDRRVDALVPLITWNDLSYSLAPNNTSLGADTTYSTPGVHKRQWTGLFFGGGIIDGVDDAYVDPDRNVGCPNFVDEACAAMAQLSAQGYPDQSTLELARHASVASYLEQITAPTLLIQGQKDTLFNLQEAAATYRGLRAQGTPARMVWQSWGHSQGGEPAPGELDLDGGSLRKSYLGRRVLGWMDHYVRGVDTAPVGPRFAYFRDWVDYDTSPSEAGTAVARAYATSDRYPVHRPERLYFSSSDALVDSADAVEAGSATYANLPGGAASSYSETSGVEGSQVDQPVSDAPGTFAAWTSEPLARRLDLVGVPRLRVHLDAPTAAATQDVDPGGRLVLFAKIYDVAPDGTEKLQHRLISPVRVTDVSEPVDVQLPGVVQRLPAGHRIRVVLAASDSAYAGNAAVHPVTVHTGPERPSRLTLPVVGPGPVF